MFNRNNLPPVPNPFGSRQDGGGRPPPRDPYGSPGQGPAPPRRSDQGYPSQGRRDYDTPMNDGYGQRGVSPQPPLYDAPVSQRAMPSRSSGMQGRKRGSGQRWQLRPAKSPDNTYTFRNLYAEPPLGFTIESTNFTQSGSLAFGYTTVTGR
jgi:vesicle-fusing ATPase